MFPGELIGTEEEFLPGRGVYSEKGDIYASLAGELHVDQKRRATIAPFERVPEIKVGSMIYGFVEEIFESRAFLSIVFQERNKKTRTIVVPGIIPVSEIKTEYVRSIRDELRVGDIVKGTVARITPFRIEVSLKGRDMGVVKAFCSRCRNALDLKGRTLECPRCGNRENRHLGFPYRQSK